MKQFSSLVIIALGISGCNLAERLSNVGEPPELSRIQNPTFVEGYQPVSMPMPEPRAPVRKINSLWETGSRAFFKDQRANKVGDVVTIDVDINDTGKFDAKPQITRTNQDTGAVNQLLRLLPTRMGNITQLNLSNNASFQGQGTYDRKDTVKFKIAASVIQVLPNGNLVISGRQELRLINEVREIQITGIVRREDITANNMVKLEKIAEARVSYGGRGDITDVNELPWGQQVLNKIYPF